VWRFPRGKVSTSDPDLVAGKFDLSQSNVAFASLGTSVTVTAVTYSGVSLQRTFPISTSGRTVRIADTSAATAWLASLPSADPVEKISYRLVGIQYFGQLGSNVVSLAAVTNSGVQVAAATHSVYRSQITPMPEPM
jgi:hypothetical protein